MVVLKASPVVSRLEDAFEEAKSKYKAVRKIHDQITDLMTIIEVQAAGEELAKHDSFIEEIMTEFGALLTKLEDYRRSQKEPALTPPEKEPKPRSNLERIKVPQFAGNIKNYRTWKRLFNEAMTRNGEDEGSQLARLIEAIQPPLRLEIENYTSTTPIWKYLDKLLGDDKELIRILMNDIKTMRSLKVKDSKSIRGFVATIRGFMLRMEDVGATEEIQSQYIFADILAKLASEDQRALILAQHDYYQNA